MENLEVVVLDLIQQICSKNREDPVEVKEIAKLFRRVYKIILVPIKKKSPTTENSEDLVGVNDEKEQISPKTYVRLIEITIQHEKFNYAHRFIFQYYQLNPEKDEYFVMAKFYHSTVSLHFSGVKRGEDLVKIISKGMAHIVEGIEIAQSLQQHYLVREGSIYFWNLIRSLNKSGTRKHLAKHYAIVVNSLNTANDPDLEWRIMNQLQLTLCHLEAGSNDLANKSLAKAVEMNKKNSDGKNQGTFRLDLLYTELFTRKKLPGGASGFEKTLLKIAMIDLFPQNDKRKMVKECAKELGCEGSKSSAKSSRSGKSSGSASGGRSGKRKKPVEGDERRLNVIARLYVSILFHFEELGDDLRKLLGRIPDLKNAEMLHTKILTEYIHGLMRIHDLGEKRHKLTSEMVKSRIKALKIIDRAIDSAKKLEDRYLHYGDVILMGCILVWNIALPLLQSNLRTRVRKYLNNCSISLKELDSHDINELRSKFHYEIANCDLEKDLLTLAHSHVKQALELDYVGMDDEQELYGIIRPLDRYLTPLYTQLELKTNIYKKPEHFEDEAYLLVEQAKDSKDINVTRTLLTRAISFLPVEEDLEEDPIPEPRFGKDWASPGKSGRSGRPGQGSGRKGALTVEEEEARSKKRKEVLDSTKLRLNLWSNIVLIAWRQKHKLVDIVRKAAPYVLKKQKVPFNVLRDREVYVERALVYRIMFESYVEEIFREDLNLGEVLEEDDPEGIDVLERLTPHILENMEKFIRMGLFCKQSWIVLNGCICAWNYHLSLFQMDRKYYPYMSILKTCCDALRTLEKYKKEYDYPATNEIVVSRIVYAYAMSLLQAFVMNKYHKDYIQFEKKNQERLRKEEEERIRQKMIEEGVQKDEKEGKKKKREEREEEEGEEDSDDEESEKKGKGGKSGKEKGEGDVLERIMEPRYVDMLDDICKREMKKSNKGNEYLNKAVNILDFAIPLVKPMVGKYMIRLRMKIDRIMNDRAPNVPSSYSDIQKLVAYGEVLSQPFPGQAEKKRVLREAFGVVQAHEEKQAVPPELHFQISTHALDCFEYTSSVHILHMVRRQIPSFASSVTPVADEEEQLKDCGVTLRMWRWYTLAVMKGGIAIHRLVDPESQNRRTMINLRMKSLEQFVLAMRLARYATDPRLVIMIAQSTEVVVKQLVDCPSARSNVVPLLTRYMKDAVSFTPKEKFHSDVFERLYHFLFKCVEQTKEYTLGLKLIKSALKHLPYSHHKNCWEMDILFRSALGQDASSSARRVQSYDVSVQSRVHAMLGHCAHNKTVKAEAFKNAIKTLKSKPSEQVLYMVEYAGWLYVNDFPLEQAKDFLMNVLHVIMDQDIQGALGDGPDGPGEDGMSRTGMSGRSGLTFSVRTGKSSASSKRSRSGRSGRSTSIAKSRRSRAKSKKGRKGTKSVARSGRSRRSSGMTGATSSFHNSLLTGWEAEEEDLEGPLGVRDLDIVCQACMMLSEVCDNSEDRLDFLLMAQFFYMRMYQAGVDYANGLVNLERDLERKEVWEEIPEDQEDKYQTPSSLDEWVGYDIETELRDLWKQQTVIATKTKKSGGSGSRVQESTLTDQYRRQHFKYIVNKFTIEYPEHTVHFLDKCFRELSQKQYFLHCLPLLILKNVIVEDVLGRPTLKDLTFLQLAHTCARLDLRDLRDAYFSQASIQIPRYVVRLKHEERDLKNAILDNSTQGSRPMSAIGSIKSFKSYVSQHRQRSRREGGLKGKARWFVENVVKGFSDGHIWARIAKNLIDLGHFSEARGFLDEAFLDAKSEHDFSALCECCQYLAMVYFHQGKYQIALKWNSQSRICSPKLSLSFTRDSVISAANILFANHRPLIAMTVIYDAFRVFDQVLLVQKNGISDSKLEYSYFCHEVAVMYLKNDVQGVSDEDIITLFTRSLKGMEEVHAVHEVRYLVILRDYAKFLFRQAVLGGTGRTKFINELVELLEQAKVKAEEVLIQVIPSGSAYRKNYPVAEVVAEIFNILGTAKLIFVELQHEIDIDQKIEKIEEKYRQGHPTLGEDGPPTTEHSPDSDVGLAVLGFLYGEKELKPEDYDLSRPLKQVLEGACGHFSLTESLTKSPRVRTLSTLSLAYTLLHHLPSTSREDNPHQKAMEAHISDLIFEAFERSMSCRFRWDEVAKSSFLLSKCSTLLPFSTSMITDSYQNFEFAPNDPEKQTRLKSSRFSAECICFAQSVLVSLELVEKFSKNKEFSATKILLKWYLKIFDTDSTWFAASVPEGNGNYKNLEHRLFQSPLFRCFSPLLYHLDAQNEIGVSSKTKKKVPGGGGGGGANSKDNKNVRATVLNHMMSQTPNDNSGNEDLVRNQSLCKVITNFTDDILKLSGGIVIPTLSPIDLSTSLPPIEIGENNTVLMTWFIPPCSPWSPTLERKAYCSLIFTHGHMKRIEDESNQDPSPKKGKGKGKGKLSGTVRVKKGGKSSRRQSKVVKSQEEEEEEERKKKEEEERLLRIRKEEDSRLTFVFDMDYSDEEFQELLEEYEDWMEHKIHYYPPEQNQEKFEEFTERVESLFSAILEPLRFVLEKYKVIDTQAEHTKRVDQRLRRKKEEQLKPVELELSSKKKKSGTQPGKKAKVNETKTKTNVEEEMSPKENFRMVICASGELFPLPFEELGMFRDNPNVKIVKEISPLVLLSKLKFGFPFSVRKDLELEEQVEMERIKSEEFEFGSKKKAKKRAAPGGKKEGGKGKVEVGIESEEFQKKEWKEVSDMIIPKEWVRYKIQVCRKKYLGEHKDKTSGEEVEEEEVEGEGEDDHDEHEE